MKARNESICVLGAGNSGMAMAAWLSHLGYRVRLWNRTASHVQGIAESNAISVTGILQGSFPLEMVTDDMEMALGKGGLVLVTTPADAHESVAIKAAPFLTPGHTVILNPGRTWGALSFYETAKKSGSKAFRIAETQTILFTCRKLSERSVNIITLKGNILISALVKGDTEPILQSLPAGLKPHFVPAGSFVETSLGNVGMILHCAPVLMNIGWIENKATEFKYYYDGITPSIASFLEKLDCERIAVAAALGCKIRSLTDWIRQSYGVHAANLYDAIKNVDAYKIIDAPLSIRHRYLFEDVATGLVPLENAGNGLGVKVKCSSLIIDLASEILDVDFRNIGRRPRPEIIKNYLG